MWSGDNKEFDRLLKAVIGLALFGGIVAMLLLGVGLAFLVVNLI
jgi:hypothetical protein